MQRLYAYFCAIAFLFGLACAVQAAEMQGRLKAIFPETKAVVVTDNAGKDWTVELAPDGKVIIDDAESPLGDLKPGDTVVVNYDIQDNRALASRIRCQRDGLIPPRSVRNGDVP